MSQTKGVWNNVHCALVREAALACQRNLVRALRDPRQVAALRKNGGQAGMKEQSSALPVAEFGSEEDRELISQTIERLGGYRGALTGQEETDVQALSIWLADAMQLFAERVELLIRERYPVAIRGGLLEGRIALWARISDLDALLPLVAPVKSIPVSSVQLRAGVVEQGSLWGDAASRKKR